MQSAPLATFFRRTTTGEFQIDSSAQLWQLLARITVRKARAAGPVSHGGGAEHRGGRAEAR